ncbi:MAG: hypothetical protein IJ291_05620 [Lachnospiraceae bacterium]|nr:hypothetical protein [Lachnospiraceae bacterium]
METLVNCDITVDIESIDSVSGGNQEYEVHFTTTDNVKYKLVFDCVWEFRCAIENAYIDRATQFKHREIQKSSVLLVENSEYIKYFAKQVSGTRPIDAVKNYIIFDSVDTIIEVLTIKEPILIKI